MVPALLSSRLGTCRWQFCSKAENWAKFLGHQHCFCTWAPDLWGRSGWFMWSVNVHGFSVSLKLCVCVLVCIRMSVACVCVSPSMWQASMYISYLCYSWALASVTKALASTPSCAYVMHGLILCYLGLFVWPCTCMCVGGTGTPGQRYTQIHREVLPLIISY